MYSLHCSDRNTPLFLSSFAEKIIGPFIRDQISRGLHKTRTNPFIRASLSVAYARCGLYKTRNTFLYHLYMYVLRVLCKPRLIWSRINGPNVVPKHLSLVEHRQPAKEYYYTLAVLVYLYDDITCL